MKKIKKIPFAIIVGIAVIAFWRGVWGLIDEYLFPANYTLSLWVSLIVGLVVLIVLHKAVRELM